MASSTRSAGRVIAIGDIHGCSVALATLVQAIKPTSDDMVIPLGDIIDYGPDSRGVLAMLRSLRVHTQPTILTGNHEEMLFEALAESYPLEYFLGVGGDATLDSYGPGRSLDLIPDEHYELLGRCRDYYETDTHIFVHANDFPDVPMAEQHVGMLCWESLRDMTPGPHESGKTVIVGHTSQKRGAILDLGHLRCIDTYCHGGGWLSALDVMTGEVWQAVREGNTRAVP